MNHAEFSEWFNYHCAAFTGVAGWLAKQSSDQRQLVTAQWRKALSEINLDEAKAATDTLFGSEAPPKYADDHPRAITKAVRERRGAAGGADRFPSGKMVTGQDGKPVWAFACHYCSDSGFVCIWLPGALACHDADPAKFDKHIDGHYVANAGGPVWCRHRVTIRCCCQRGRAYGSDWCKFVFNPQRNWRVFAPDGADTLILESLLNYQAYLEAPAAEEFDASKYKFPDD